jgi:hypothetical protein
MLCSQNVCERVKHELVVCFQQLGVSERVIFLFCYFCDLFNCFFMFDEWCLKEH